MHLHRVLALATSSPWAVLPRHAEVLAEILTRHARSARGLVAVEAFDVADVAARRTEIEAQRGAAAGASGSVAVVPVLGTIIPRASMLEQQSGATSPESIGAAIDRAVADPSVKTILLDVNSPGGSVQGVTELAAKIRAARAVKPVVAVANYLCASAAYWIAAQADELVASPSSELGSLGTLMMHEDISGAAEQAGVKVSFITAGANKAEGNPYEPLADGPRAEMKAKVDATYGVMTADIAKGRGVAPSLVRGASWGQGRTLLAADAVKVGMADRVATFEETLARFAGGGRVVRGAKAIAGYAASFSCASCGVLRWDRDEDMPLDARVVAHVEKTHECSPNSRDRAARCDSFLRAAVARGERPSMQELVASIDAAAAADVDETELRAREFAWTSRHASRDRT